MHNRKVLIGTAVNYAASNSSASANTALLPGDLAVGAIGVYGIHEAGSTNLQKLVLLTDGGGESAGKIAAASFVGKEIFIARGNAINASGTNSIEVSNPITLGTLGGAIGLKRCNASKYTAPVRGVYRVGYNGTAGTSLNLPATINRGDDFTIGILNRNYFVSGSREPFQKIEFSYGTTLSQGTYSILSGWLAKINLRTDNILIDKTLLKILHNGTGAVFTNSATVAGVNGATSLTTSANHGLSVGDYLSLNGDLYQAITGTAATTIVLDRPYQQATGTVVNANTLDITVNPTAWGVELVDNADGSNIEAVVSGITQDATRLRYTAPQTGNGTYLQVLAMEKDALPKKGTEMLADATIPHDSYKANSTKTYDLYVMQIENKGETGLSHSSVFKITNYLTLAFESGIADTAGFNQGDWENIMTSLFGATFPAISA